MNNEKTLIKAERYKETENIIKNKILVDNSCIYNFSFHTAAALSRATDLKIFCPNWRGISEYQCPDRRTYGRQQSVKICACLFLLYKPFLIFIFILRKMRRFNLDPESPPQFLMFPTGSITCNSPLYRVSSPGSQPN